MGVCPEREHEYDGCYGSAEEQPWTEASPAGVGLVGESADDGVVDGVPDA